MTDELLKYVGEENIYGMKLGVFGNKEQPLYSATDFARAIGYCHATRMRKFSQQGMVMLRVKTKQGTPTPMWLIDKDGINKILSEKKTHKAKEIWDKVAPKTDVDELTLPFVEEVAEETPMEMMSGNGIKIFANAEFGKIRTVEKNGEPLFCLIDIAKALKYTYPVDAVRYNCKEVEFISTPTAGGMQKMKYGSERQVYRLVIRSKAPNAEKFQDWICDEVLPSIRKTGGYIATTPDMTDAEIMSRAIMIAQNTIAQQGEKLKALQAQFDSVKAENTELQTTNTELQATNTDLTNTINTNAPKVVFAKSIERGDAILMQKLAGILQKNGIKTGQNRLFKWMRENGYTCNRKGSKNYPTQKALEMGVLTVIERPVYKPTGIKNTFTTLVTGKGQVYFVDVFCRHLLL